MINNIWVIMPVYNEEESVARVIKEWLLELKKYQFNFTFCVLNDGSTDKTLSILNHLGLTEKNILVIDKSNSGHGQTCIEGYRRAIKNNADWVFQIDSDGQCDPQYFNALLSRSQNYDVVYGFRKTRDDGFKRYVISRIVSFFVFAATKIWVRDANVPYRLMSSRSLETIVDNVPSDFYLANIYVSVLQKKVFDISWVDIHFRDRIGGTPSVKTFSFLKHGLKLFKQLKAAINESA